MKDAGTGLKKYRRPALVRAEKYQASYFGYKSLGFLAWVLPAKLLRGYMEKRFFEQSEKQQHRFESMTVHNKRRRERFLKKVSGGCKNGD